MRLNFVLIIHKKRIARRFTLIVRIFTDKSIRVILNEVKNLVFIF